mgnify:CR=1 FL=1
MEPEALFHPKRKKKNTKQFKLLISVEVKGKVRDLLLAYQMMYFAILIYRTQGPIAQSRVIALNLVKYHDKPGGFSST